MGLVHVKGKVMTEMGYQVKSNDEVKFDGSRIQKTPPVYLLLNKPKGFVATSQSGVTSKSVQDLISSVVKTKVPELSTKALCPFPAPASVVTEDQPEVKEVDLYNSPDVPGPI